MRRRERRVGRRQNGGAGGGTESAEVIEAGRSQRERGADGNAGESERTLAFITLTFLKRHQ